MDIIDYNGKPLSRTNILSMETDSMEPWEKAIFNFLKLWVDERPYITLKTSGSTGAPKNIQLPKATMASSAHYTCKYLKLQKGDSALLCLPVDYIGGKMMLVRAFVCGLKITAVKPGSVIRFGKKSQGQSGNSRTTKKADPGRQCNRYRINEQDQSFQMRRLPQLWHDRDK